MATTTPYDLVCPLAGRLGFDDVLATRYGEVDGVYTGALEGSFVWSTGKRSVVRAWAADHDVDLAASWAYSDSFYDVPLLVDVGHPTAVNPDPRLWLVATLRRWPVRHLDAPPGVPKVAGLEPLDLARLLARPEMFPYARFDFAALEHVPRHGPVIVVSNHRSYFDPVALGLALFRVGRKPRFLGKQEVFDAPVLGQMMRAMGQIAVDREAIAAGRGAGGDPVDDAARAVAAGECLVVLPQGTIPRGRAFYDPVLEGKTGAARLAARTRAPVIPIGVWGSEEVWPRCARLPDLTRVTSPPHIGVRAGPPVPLGLVDPVADTTTLMAAIADLLPPEARVQREPTDAEILRATPPA
jgi:putative phosphoserine phosphatase/1-acylglycerol-3-phosphate O-acyltransferase